MSRNIKRIRSRNNQDEHNLLSSSHNNPRNHHPNITMDSSVDPESLTPEDYLDRYGISAYIREVLSLVLENRPQAPIEFVAEYFRNAVQGSSYLHRAYRLVHMTDRGRPGFLGNVMKAHQVLAHRKGSIGVTGEEMTKLLSLICHKFPPKISKTVLNVVFSSEQYNLTDIIEFDIFYLSVSICLLFVEHIEYASQYFSNMLLEDTIHNQTTNNDAAATTSSTTTEDATFDNQTQDTTHTTHDGTRQQHSSSDTIASISSLLTYLRRKNAEKLFPNPTPEDERLFLSTLEKTLNETKGNENGINLETFCEILVMQVLPQEM